MGWNLWGPWRRWRMAPRGKTRRRQVMILLAWFLWARQGMVVARDSNTIDKPPREEGGWGHRGARNEAQRYIYISVCFPLGGTPGKTRRKPGANSGEPGGSSGELHKQI